MVEYTFPTYWIMQLVVLKLGGVNLHFTISP
jgi:hypothetical protein